MRITKMKLLQEERELSALEDSQLKKRNRKLKVALALFIACEFDINACMEISIKIILFRYNAVQSEANYVFTVLRIIS